MPPVKAAKLLLVKVAKLLQVKAEKLLLVKVVKLPLVKVVKPPPRPVEPLLRKRMKRIPHWVAGLPDRTTDSCGYLPRWVQPSGFFAGRARI